MRVVCVCMILFFFFFKQKTAYEMRISDWSSDVCSSDLERDFAEHVGELDLDQLVRGQRPAELPPIERILASRRIAGFGGPHRAPGDPITRPVQTAARRFQAAARPELLLGHLDSAAPDLAGRSEESPVGKERGRQCCYRGL